MKKLILSAVMMMAFVGTSMANSPIKKVYAIKSSKVILHPCDAAGRAAFRGALDCGCTFDEASAIRTSVRAACRAAM